MTHLTNLIKEALRTPPPRLNTDKLSKEEFEHLMTITGKRPMSLDKILDLLLKDGAPISLDVVIKLEPQLKLKQDIRNLNEARESLNESKKKDCNCGCNTCENVGNEGVLLNESVAPKQILSENLQYHVHNKLPLTENTFRYGSQSFINLWAEARALYLREIIHVNNDDKEILTETDLGNYGMYEGKKVPLDMPLDEESVNESFKKGDKVKFVGEKSIFKNLDPNKTYIIDDVIRDTLFDDVRYVIDYNQELTPLEANDIQLAEKEGVPHYTKDNKEWKGKVHKMPDGSLMSGNPHDKDGSGPNGESEKLYHKGESVNEAKNDNKPLNKPKRGGSKAYYVYVKDPRTKKVKKVSFGSGGLKAKINNKEARKAFAARHKCSTKKDKTKAGYWSCNLPRYAKLLGIKSSFSGFW